MMTSIKLWKWQSGRQQNTDYQKFLLWYFKIWKWGFDGYILKYKPNTQLNWHKDPIENGNHYRLNIKLKGKSWFYIKKKDLLFCVGKKIIFFRPDLYEHSLIIDSPCTKLSLGFVKFK